MKAASFPRKCWISWMIIRPRLPEKCHIHCFYWFLLSACPRFRPLAWFRPPSMFCRFWMILLHLRCSSFWGMPSKRRTLSPQKQLLRFSQCCAEMLQVTRGAHTTTEFCLYMLGLLYDLLPKSEEQGIPILYGAHVIFQQYRMMLAFFYILHPHSLVRNQPSKISKFIPFGCQNLLSY